jgi:hypothetical protein
MIYIPGIIFLNMNVDKDLINNIACKAQSKDTKLN